MNCDYRTIESLAKYNENLAEIKEKIANEEYDELIISGNFHSDPNQNKFYKESKCCIDVYELVCPDIDRLPTDSYACISRNKICSTNWLDHVITLKNHIVMNNIEYIYSTWIYYRSSYSCEI